MADLTDDQFLVPQETVGWMDPNERSKLAEYLDSGYVAEMYLGHSWCRFGCGIPDNQMGSTELHDGAWMWPEGLSHYVLEHGVLLPEEFVAHALEHYEPGMARRREQERLDRPVPAPLPGEDYGYLDYWKEWCSSKRSQEVKSRIRIARTKADKRAAAIRKRRQLLKIMWLVAKHGRDNDLCAWAGCEGRVLSNKAICAAHYDGELYCPQADVVYQLTPRLVRKLFNVRCR